MSGQSSNQVSRPAYWSIKVYEDDEERETIRGLNVTKKDTLMQVFDRTDIHAKALGYNADGSSMVDSESVNSPWGDA